MSPPKAFPDGHFYSPIVDADALAAHAQRLWPADPEVQGIDFDREGQRRLLKEAFARYLPEFDYPERAGDGPDGAAFYVRNSQFSWLDCRALYALVRHWQPKRIVEVGSGYSTLLIADVNRRHFEGAIEFSAIEPYPRQFLRAGVPGLTRLVEADVQDVPMDMFLALRAGDILFIDSSHVAKAGSDVNHLFFEILPRLAPGVRIHVHDVFLPHEYPKEWVLEEGRHWNEQYLLRALLMFSRGFRVLFGSSYAYHVLPEDLRDALGSPDGRIYGGGSLWIERTGEVAKWTPAVDVPPVSAGGDLEFTGERFIPGTLGEIWLEHWHRYHFVAPFVAGRRVLDVACGEGYGSALLARHAAQATGADISQAAIAHARKAYAAIPNLAFACAPCTALPVADASQDVVVSFETIEHIHEQREFLDEIARVLAPDGVLILSCPNKREYTDRRGYVNEFHVKELYREELAALVAERFAASAWYGQRLSFFSVLAPEAPPAAGQALDAQASDPSHPQPGSGEPLYFLVVAARTAEALAKFPATLSVLADRDDFFKRDYEKVTREMRRAAEMLGDREAALAQMRSALDDATAAARRREDERARQCAQLEDTIAQREHAVDLREREIQERYRWKWWLTLPLIRLGLLKAPRVRK